MSSRPMGFRHETVVAKPRLLLIASLAQVGAGNLAELVDGADAGLLAITKPASGIKALEEIVQKVPDIPWGVWLDSISQPDTKKTEKAGVDFLLFPAVKMPLSILGAGKLGKVLAVEASLDSGLLRTVNELPADAVFAISHQGETSLTWQHLMLFRRLADLLVKPLLVPALPSVTIDELQALWEAGVDGVVVEVAPGKPEGGCQKLRQMIDSLVPPVKHKRMKTRALVPQVREEAAPIPEEVEEEE